jgi:hypothetical protein
MDPVSLVVGALAAGLSETMTSAVQDAYAGLRDALLRRLRQDHSENWPAEQAVQALEAQSGDPQLLRAVVSSAGLATDEQVVAAAQHVLQMADPTGARVGRYVIDLRGATGVQVGENPTMTINF